MHLLPVFLSGDVNLLFIQFHMVYFVKHSEVTAFDKYNRNKPDCFNCIIIINVISGSSSCHFIPQCLNGTSGFVLCTTSLINIMSLILLCYVISLMIFFSLQGCIQPFSVALS